MKDKQICISLGGTITYLKMIGVFYAGSRNGGLVIWDLNASQKAKLRCSPPLLEKRVHEYCLMKCFFFLFGFTIEMTEVGHHNFGSIYIGYIDLSLSL